MAEPVAAPHTAQPQEPAAQDPMKMNPLSFEPRPLEFEESADAAPPTVIYRAEEPAAEEPESEATPALQATPELQASPALQPIPARPGTRDSLGGYWNNLLTGDADTVPDVVRHIAGADAADLSPDERDYRIYSTINRSWYADHRESNRAKVRANWPQMRSQLAQELNVADDEREIYMALSERYSQKNLRDAAAAVYDRAYRAALSGEPAPDLSDITKNLPAEYAVAAHMVAVQAEDEARYKREYYMPLAEELANGMKVFAAMEEDIIYDEVIRSAPALIAAVNRYTKMPQEEKQLVTYLAVQRSRAQRRNAADEGLGSRVVRGFRRGINNLGMGIGHMLAYVGSATLQQLGDSTDNRSMQEYAAKIDKCMQALQQIRNVTMQEVMPLELPGSSMAEKILLTAVEAAPTAVLTLAGGSGLALMMASGAGNSIVEGRLRSPETAMKYHMAAGTISGVTQAAIFMKFTKFGGRMLDNTIHNFMKSAGKGVGEFGMAAAKSAVGISAEGARLMALGKIAQASDLSLHELASEFDGKNSHIDWKEVGAGMLDEEVNMREAAALLPFMLIGAGRAALHHFRDPHHLVGDGTRLLELGVDEHVVTQIVNERNVFKKGMMLREALSRNAMKISPELLDGTVKVMRCLNPSFDSMESVIEFLRLPSTVTIARSKTPPGLTMGDAADSPTFTLARSSERVKNVLALRDEWESQAHLSENSSRSLLREWQLHTGANAARYEHSARYLAELQSKDSNIPKRMQASAPYIPGAELERRALMHERVSELQDLSYQFLLNVNPPEALIYKDYPLSRIRTEAEHTRELLLGNIGTTLVNAGLGMPREENLGQLCDWFQGYYIGKKYRENNRGARIDWIREVPADYLRRMSTHALLFDNAEYMEYPELLDAYRIYLGVRTNAELLMDLLPMTEDFQTALSRGMSPAQAYELLAERELGYKKENLKKYPAELVQQSLNITPMEEYTLMNEEKCRYFMQLSGAALEQQPGDDGKTYWRLRRPNGSFSRWHESAAYAMNDVAANAALTFLPLGKGIHEHWAQTARANNTNLLQLPLAKNNEYSGYDYLCHQALGDLITCWAESAPYVQPGWQVQRLGHMFVAGENADFAKPGMYLDMGVADLPEYRFDALTVATPFSFASSRFYSAWQRLLATDALPPQQAEAFLNSLGAPWSPDAATLPPPQNAEAHRTALAHALTDFSEQYFLMKLPQLPLPPSVIEWAGLAPFCPPVAETAVPGAEPKYISASNAVSWGNRRAAAEIRELMPMVDLLRRSYGESPLPDAHVQVLLDGMLGVDPVQNAEQAWCYYYSGAQGLHTLSPAFMNLLRSPAEWWPRMAAAEQRLLYDYLMPFCEQNLPPGTAAGTDAVVAALSNLSTVLQQHPQLHDMSLAGENRNRVLTLQLPPQYEGSTQPGAEPEFSIPEFPYAKEVRELGNYTDAEMPPQLADPAVHHAMSFLDVLRRYPSRLPYATQSGIRWNHLTYGGKTGLRPAGLEQHVAVSPLARIKRLLKEVNEACTAQGKDTITIGGVSLAALQPHELACPALQNITVYRNMLHGFKNRDITDLCRLMPGDAMAPDARARAPYVVDVRRGVYMGAESSVKDAADLLLTMVPLQSYTPLPYRYINEAKSRTWGGKILNHALEGLYKVADADVSFMEHRMCNGLSLTEVLMRLFEDTNFSTGVLGKQNLRELSAPALRSLSLASDIISCLAAPYSAVAPESVRAFGRLQKNVRRILADDANREALEHILSRGSSFLQNRVNPTLPTRAENNQP